MVGFYDHGAVGVTAFDFATVSGYDQLVVSSISARGGTLHLLMTDAPGLVYMLRLLTTIGNSDRTSLSRVISIAQAVLTLCARMKDFFKYQVNWNTVYGVIKDLPKRNIWSAGNPVEVLNKHLSLLAGRYVLNKVIRVHNKDKP